MTLYYACIKYNNIGTLKVSNTYPRIIFLLKENNYLRKIVILRLNIYFRPNLSLKCQR